MNTLNEANKPNTIEGSIPAHIGDELTKKELAGVQDSHNPANKREEHKTSLPNSNTDRTDLNRQKIGEITKPFKGDQIEINSFGDALNALKSNTETPKGSLFLFAALQKQIEQAA